MKFGHSISISEKNEFKKKKSKKKKLSSHFKLELTVSCWTEINKNRNFENLFLFLVG